MNEFGKQWSFFLEKKNKKKNKKIFFSFNKMQNKIHTHTLLEMIAEKKSIIWNEKKNNSGKQFWFQILPR